MTTNQIYNRSKLNAFMLNELQTRGHKFTKSDMGYYIGNVLGAFDVHSIYCMSYSKAQMRAEFDRVFGTNEEPNIIEFSDGFKFEVVSENFAEKNWDKFEIYGIRIAEESEALIESAEDLSAFDTFGVEAKPCTMNSKLKARVKKHKYGHLIGEELLRQGETSEWINTFGGRGLGCYLLPDEGRRVSQSFGDLVIDILRSRESANK